MSGNAFADWVKLELPLNRFVASRFADQQQHVESIGVRLTTLAALGKTLQNQRKLYELNADVSADIPNRGTFHSWEEYQKERLASRSFLPHGVVLALDGDEWVGLSAISHRDDFEFVFQEITGTVRSHRGLGIAVCMKVRAVEIAASLGVRSIRTIHHPDNEAMIALNRKLGFVDADFDYPVA